MKSLSLILCCLLLLIGCRPVAQAPYANPVLPNGQVLVDPVTEPKTTELIKAVAFVDGDEYLLYSSELNQVLAKGGTVIFEYSSPITLPPDSDAVLLEGSCKVQLLLPPTATLISTPNGVKANGNTLMQRRFALSRYSFLHPDKATWISADGTITEELIAGTNWAVLMPGEKIILEFPSRVDQDVVTSLLKVRLQGINHRLEWLDEKTLSFLVTDSTKDHAYLGFDDNEQAAWLFVLSTPQKVVVIDPHGQTLSTTVMPFSTTGAIGMTADFEHVRLTRTSYFNWFDLRLLEYHVDLITGLIVATPKLHASWIPEFVLLDWLAETRRAAQTITDIRGPSGLSHRSDRLALYEWQKIRVIDTASNTSRTYPTNSRTGAHGDFPEPKWIYWSHDDTSLYYTADIDETGLYHGIYRLDLKTGQEELLLRDHLLLGTSPYSDYLFTQSWDGEPSYSIVNGGGNITKISGRTEQVHIAKWIDEDRALINKSTPALFFHPDSKCYIYHLVEDRWEYICEGYGFDYDAATGRVFVLQNR